MIVNTKGINTIIIIEFIPLGPFCREFNSQQESVIKFPNLMRFFFK